MIQKRPSTNTLPIHEHKLNELLLYPPKALILDISGYTGSILNINPLPNRNGEDDYVVWVNGVTYEGLYDSTNPSTIDLTNTGLGGLVDGITFTAANARDFLIWGLANNANNGFDGFAVTHKPYSSYTGPAAAAMGATITFTGLTSAYQFTVGARAVVRNQETNGGATPAPQYQWNWGTITEIVSSTSIKIAMDNNAAYGVALTAATSGEILQWDKFRPWVVTTSSQTLYTNNYRLIGELYTDTSGNIESSYRVDEDSRALQTGSLQARIYDNTSAQPGLSQSMGRVCPLWCKSADYIIVNKDTVVGNIYNIQKVSGFGQVQSIITVASVDHRESGHAEMGTYSINRIVANYATIQTFIIDLVNYYVPGGMRE